MAGCPGGRPTRRERSLRVGPSCKGSPYRAGRRTAGDQRGGGGPLRVLRAASADAALAGGGGHAGGRMAGDRRMAAAEWRGVI